MHTSTNKGKRVRVKLTNGEVFVDKFLDKKGNFIHFEEKGKIAIKDVQSFGINKLKC